MSFSSPTGAFSMGTSDPSTDRVDMSLDDIIQKRREDSKSYRNRGGMRTRAQKAGNKPTSLSARLRKVKPTSAQVSAGRTAAKRSRDLNKRRGIVTRGPISQDIRSEVRKRQRVDNRGREPKNAPRKAVRAAVKAMNDAGFKAPVGTKIEINFVPKGSNNKRHVFSTPGRPRNNHDSNRSSRNGGRGRGRGRRR